MPELIEIERYRRLAEGVVGRTVARADAPDAWFLKRGLTARAVRVAVAGTTVVRCRRIGKLLLVDLRARAGEEPVLGLRFGMTGRLLVDSEDRHPWDRFALHFDGGGDLRIRDPRRLGGVELDPDEGRLGPDALSLTRPALADALRGSVAPVKARLMDQSRIAGLGNLLVDETLFRAGIDPTRTAATLDPEARRKLHRSIRSTLNHTMRRGGSHTGRLPRDLEAPCPKCGAPIRRRTVAGRTTYSCSRHQR